MSYSVVPLLHSKNEFSNQGWLLIADKSCLSTAVLTSDISQSDINNRFSICQKVSPTVVHKYGGIRLQHMIVTTLFRAITIGRHLMQANNGRNKADHQL